MTRQTIARNGRAIPYYITEDASRMVARPEVREAFASVIMDRMRCWSDWEALTKRFLMEPDGAMASECLRLLYGYVPRRYGDWLMLDGVSYD